MQVALVASRFLLFGLVFLVLRLEPRGDVPVYYFTEAAHTLAGKLPYRDFVSSYAPLHPYMDALMLRLWFSPLSIILLAICAECLVLPVWFRAGRSFLTEAEMRTGAILYVTSAVSLQYVTIDGQDNVIIAVFLVVAILLLGRNRNVLAGIASGAGVVAMKFLALVYAPAFFVSTRGRWRWAAGMALIIGAVYGGFLLLRLPILEPLAVEGKYRSPGNLPYLLEGLTGRTLPSAVYDGALLVALGGIFYLLARVSRNATTAVRLRALTYGLVAVTVAVDLLAKKSWPAYLMLALFPICTLIRAERKVQVLAFAFFTVIALVEHSYWASYLYSAEAPLFHVHLVALEGRCLVFVALEVLLLIFYGWLLQLSIREMLASAGADTRMETAR